MRARRILLVFCLAVASAAAGAGEAFARRPDVAVQPVVGGQGKAGQKVGQSLRREIARTVRARGLRVTTEIPQAEGTGQYYTWAREVGLRAFVSTELVGVGRRGSRQRATVLVWSGHDGAIVGRWSVVAPAANLPRVVARGFWPRLGRSIRRTKLPPEWRQMTPGPTQRIDAGLAADGSITGLHAGRRRPR